MEIEVNVSCMTIGTDLLRGFFMGCVRDILFFFFFNDTATTEIYTLSLHDALPICSYASNSTGGTVNPFTTVERKDVGDRKSTRLNSSHLVISYAVFCLKKKKTKSSHNTISLHRLESIQDLHSIIK